MTYRTQDDSQDKHRISKTQQQENKQPNLKMGERYEKTPLQRRYTDGK